MAKKRGYRVDANFTEDAVGLALEGYLSLISFPRKRFSIVPFSRKKERWLGADARLSSSIQGFHPFYMQFKRPAAYPDFSSSKIIKNRAQLKLRSDPYALFFKLQPKEPAHKDFQHNVLFRLRRMLTKKGIGDATYVCPLFVERSNYTGTVHRSGILRWAHFWRSLPWEMEDLLLSAGGQSIAFEKIPVLPEHVSIPPHEKVSSANHSYSFSDSGTDLCFHSPEIVPQGIETLDKFLARVAANFLGRTEKIGMDQADLFLSELMSETFGSDDIDKDVLGDAPRDPMGRWFSWGDYMSENYGVSQFAIVKWRDDAFPIF